MATWSRFLLAAAVTSCSAGLVHAQEPARKPNIVFIMADDYGWMDSGVYGSQYYKTPNIDKLASQGVRFVNAYAANPLCSPTRASVLTGLFPGRIGITAPVCHVPEVQMKPSVADSGNPAYRAVDLASVTRLDTQIPTISKTLKAAGYATGHFGKWHLGSEPFSPLQNGFDVDIPHWPGPGPAGTFVAPWHYPPALKFTGKDGEHIEDRMAIEASKFIAANKDKPFYLNYWAFSVHSPYDAKRDYVNEALKDADTNKLQHNATYAAMVRSLDDAVGTLMTALDENGVAQNTIVVFTSDNGGVDWTDHNYAAPEDNQRYGKTTQITSNAPLRGGKATIYEGGTREPLIVRLPGVAQAGRVTPAMVQSVDYYPTLMELTGHPAPKDVDGVSFAKVVRGETDTGKDHIFTFFPHNVVATGNLASCSVREGDFKLIRFFFDAHDNSGDHRYELYNLKDDLSEKNNLADQMPDRVKAMDALIEQHLKDTGALLPKRNPRFDGSVVPANIVGERSGVPNPDATTRPAADKGKRPQRPGRPTPQQGPNAGPNAGPKPVKPNPAKP